MTLLKKYVLPIFLTTLVVYEVLCHLGSCPDPNGTVGIALLSTVAVVLAVTVWNRLRKKP